MLRTGLPSFRPVQSSCIFASSTFGSSRRTNSMLWSRASVNCLTVLGCSHPLLKSGRLAGLLSPMFSTPIGTWATIEAGRQLSGIIASLGFLLIPALGVLLSNFWLGEPLGWDILLGGALILGSVLVAARG